MPLSLGIEILRVLQRFFDTVANEMSDAPKQAKIQILLIFVSVFSLDALAERGVKVSQRLHYKAKEFYNVNGPTLYNYEREAYNGRPRSELEKS